MRIVIVEDDHLLRENLKLLLGGEKGITVIAAFASAEEALDALSSALPEVMLVDIGLPGMSGIELIGQVKSKIPDMEIMAYTVFDDRDNVFSALKAGASGYILKGSTPRELVEALFELYDGGAPMSPKIARAVVREFQPPASTEEHLLSHREKEILDGLERGLTYKEIAADFNLSIHTVHTHIKNIYEKLHAKSRTEVFLKARRKGIL